MKAARIARFGTPEVFSIDELPMPIPAAGEALIRVKACGVNRMDTELRAGTYGGEPLADFFFGKQISLPHLPGIEPAGIVESLAQPISGTPVGASASISVGSRVVPHSHLSCGRCKHCLAGYDNACSEIAVLGVQTPGRGGYAQYFTWPVSHLMPFADTLSYEQAASLLVNYGPVWFGMVERGNVKPGEIALITGAAGGCGHAALDIARHLGARAIAVTRSPAKVKSLIAAGANEVIIDRGDGKWSEEVLELTSGAGADCVVELVGAASWQQSIQSAGARSRVIVIGSHTGLNVSLNLGAVFGKNLSIIGITRANRNAMESILRLAEQGDLSPQIGHTLKLEDVAEAHRLMDAAEHSGKIVLTID